MLIQLQYLLEVSTCMLLGFLIYWFFLRKKKLYQWNRAYLMIWPICSFLIPAMEFNWVVWTEVSQLSLPGIAPNWMEAERIFNQIQANEFSEGIEGTQELSIEKLSFPIYSLIYSLGVFISFLLFIFRILQIKRLISSSTQFPQKGYTLLENAQLNSISTFGKYIFKRKGEKIHPMILEHELVHVRQKHSFDLILMEVYQIILWFNPIIYFMKKELRETHEYIADAKVIHNHDLLSYAQLLVKEAIKHRTPAMSIPFSHITKKRLINMKTKTKENPWSRFRFMVLLPLFLLLVAVFAFNKVEKSRYVEKKVVAPIVIQWGDQMCQCFESNYKRSYTCDIMVLSKEKVEAMQTITPKILRNAAFPKDVIYEDLGQPDEYAVKYTLGDPNEMGTPIYFAEAYEDLDPKVWNQLKPEDKLRFRLNFQEELFVEFNVAVAGKHPDRIYTSEAYFGKEKISFDLATEKTYKSGYVEDFRKLIDSEISLKINGNLVPIQAIDINRKYNDDRYAYIKTERIMSPEMNRLKINNLPSEAIFQDLAPGELLTLRFIHRGGHTYTLNYQVEGVHPISKKKVNIKWGPYESRSNQLSIELDEIPKLKHTLPRIYVNGKLQKIYQGNIFFRNLDPSDDQVNSLKIRRIKSYSVNQFQDLVNKRLSHMEEKTTKSDRFWLTEYLFNWMTIPLEDGTHFTFYIKKEGKEAIENQYFDRVLADIPQHIPFSFPLNEKYSKISSGFGHRIHPITKKKKHHNGVDFAAPIGAPVYSVASGEVSKIIDDPKTYGKRIEITHGQGKVTTYSHLQTILVKEGDRIKGGLIQIGTVGNTGQSFGPHLHFEILINEKHQNPMDFLPELK